MFDGIDESGGGIEAMVDSIAQAAIGRRAIASLPYVVKYLTWLENGEDPLSPYLVGQVAHNKGGDGNITTTLLSLLSTVGILDPVLVEDEDGDEVLALDKGPLFDAAVSASSDESRVSEISERLDGNPDGYGIRIAGPDKVAEVMDGDDALGPDEASGEAGPLDPDMLRFAATQAGDAVN